MRGATNVAAESLSIPLDFLGGGTSGLAPSLYALGTPHGSKLVIGTPKTASWIAASRSCKSEDLSLEPLTETTIVSAAAGRIFSTNLVRVERGPNSTKTRAPSRCIARTCSTHLTDDTMCLLRRATDSAALPLYAALPVTLEYTLAVAGLNALVASRTRASKTLLADFMSGVWKAPLTLSGTTRKPAALSFADSEATADSAPEMTTCEGSLMLASHTLAPETTRSDAPGPITAAIAWPLASFAEAAIAVARWQTRSHALVRSRTPPAYSAASSPSECPAVKSALQPAAARTSYAPTETAVVQGCACSVSCITLSWSGLVSLPYASRGKRVSETRGVPAGRASTEAASISLMAVRTCGQFIAASSNI